MENVKIETNLNNPTVLNIQGEYEIISNLLTIAANHLAQGHKLQATTYINSAICVAKSVAYQEIEAADAMEDTTEGCN